MGSSQCACDVHENVRSEDDKIGSGGLPQPYFTVTSPLSNQNMDDSLRQPDLSRPESSPMMTPSFLASPVDTLLESLSDRGYESVSLHDLVEAYNVLSSRLRSQAGFITTTRQIPPALEWLKMRTPSLSNALRRDVRRALLDPLLDLGEMSATDTSMSEYDIQCARDQSLVAQHSLCLISDVFAFQALHSLFDTRDLEDLLDATLKVALAPAFPTPNGNRTWALAYLAIREQTLPDSILRSRSEDLMKAWTQALFEEKGHQPKLDSLKAIHSILKSQADFFIIPVSKLFPATLNHLLFEEEDCRLHAAYALSGFALAKVTSPQFPDQLMSRTLEDFLVEATERQPSQEEIHLPTIIRTALTSRDANQLSWGSVVLTSLVILSDYLFFTRPRSLKLCLSNLGAIGADEDGPICALHKHVWRSLVWAYSRFPRSSERDHSHVGNDIRMAALEVVKQELKGGVGVALVTALLGPKARDEASPDSFGDLLNALDVIKELVVGKNSSNGLLVLNRVLGGVGVVDVITSDGFALNVRPAIGMLDGTILDAKITKFKHVVASLDNVSVLNVRRLSDKEISCNWDALLDLWIHSAEVALQNSAVQLPMELLQSWQSLLLSRADLTQEHSRHLTASSGFTGEIVLTVIRFIEVAESVEPLYQSCRLIFVKRLWMVMKNVFSASWFPVPAEFILATVLKHQFALTDGAVKTAWCDLAAELISVGIPTLLHVVFTRSQNREGFEMTRQLWTILAKNWQDPSAGSHWEYLTSFLSIPLGTWKMSDHEFGLWAKTMQCAVDLAQADNISPIVPVEKLLQGVDKTKLTALASFPKGVCTLLSLVEIPNSGTLPQATLTLVEQTLNQHYPPQPEDLAPCLDIAFHLGRLVSSAPCSAQLPLVHLMNKPLCLWMTDQANALLNAEYDNLVYNVYHRILQTLKARSPSSASLQLLTPFLLSVFDRDPPSHTAVTSFSNFWRATYHGLTEFRPFYSEALTACLLACQDAYGGSIADGLSMPSESQKSKMSTVPDSQDPGHGADPKAPYNNTESLLNNDKTRSSVSPGIPMGDMPSPDARLRESKKRRVDSPMPSNQPDALFSHGNSGSHPQTPSRPKTFLEHHDSSYHTPRDEHSSPFKRPSNDSEISEEKKRRKMDRDPVGRNQPSPESAHHLSDGNFLPEDSITQDTQHRKRKRVSSWVMSSMVWNKQELAGGGLDDNPLSENVDPSHTPRTRPDPQDDYDSWEIGLSNEELVEVQRELGGQGTCLLDDDIQEPIHSDTAEDSKDVLGRCDTAIVNPSHLLNPQGPRRAQTAPARLPPTPSPDPPPLRRTHTISARLDALQRAYTLVSNDVSQIAIEDLVHATSLVNKIHTTLNEQIERRLVDVDGTTTEEH